MVVRPTTALFYPGMDRFRAAVLKQARSQRFSQVSLVVIDGTVLTKGDYSLRKGITNLRGDLERMGKQLRVIRLRPAIEDMIIENGPDDEEEDVVIGRNAGQLEMLSVELVKPKLRVDKK